MGLKIVGAGLGRTGTLSLKLALEQLGFGPCYHMTEVFLNPHHVPLWLAAAEGHPDWDTVLKDFASTVDYPGCTYWRQLVAHYPDARVLLSVRDPDQWFESTQATIFSPESIQRLSTSPMRPFFEKTVWGGFGSGLHDRAVMTEAFKRHNAEVIREVPKDRLLVYEVKQGWEPLCTFLGVPVPSAPFPRVNSREEMAAMVAEHSTGDPNAPLDLAKLQETLRAKLKGNS